MNTNIKNIIFDLGNVLVGLDWQRCIDAFSTIGIEKVAQLIKEGTTKDLFFDTEVGNINSSEFYDRVRKIGDVSTADEQILWAWNQLLTDIPDIKKQRLIALNQRYNVLLLSNTNEMHWQKCAIDLFPYKADQSDVNEKGARGKVYTAEEYFQKIYLSYEMHLIKPSLEIFQTVLQTSHLCPEETLFIDDSKANCAAAASLGIQTYCNEHPNDWLSLDL